MQIYELGAGINHLALQSQGTLAYLTSGITLLATFVNLSTLSLSNTYLLFFKNKLKDSASIVL